MVYLAHQPLLWLTVTLLAYMAGHWLFVRSGQRAWVNPVAIAGLLLALILVVTGTEYSEYFEGAQFVHFLLGPATVALAWPLHKNWASVSKLALPLFCALLAGSLIAVGSAVAIATRWALRPRCGCRWRLNLLPAVAMGVAEKIGGLPALTAGLVVSTGSSAQSW